MATLDVTDLFLFAVIILSAACAWGLAARFYRWLDKRVKKDIDGSRVALTDAQARPGEAHGCYVEDDRTKQLREAYAKKRQPLTEWERASRKEYWEHFCAQEDAKRRAK